MTHEYKITGMTCNHCVAKVKNELLKLGNVISADIQLSSPEAIISMTKHIGTATLQQAVSKAGDYTIAESGSPRTGRHAHAGAATEEKPSYFPILLLFGFITGITLLVQAGKSSFDGMQWITDFMAGFFLVFSFFKLMNLEGFAEGYSHYDVVAKRFVAWGYIYPFIELLLGIAFLMRFEPLVTNMVTFVVMSISTYGVVKNLLRKTPFQCACLGTIIKLPLSKLTLLEDLLMVVMSLLMVVKIL
ncbi:MAG: heavy-metal-associated domain-containing protein [Bacteroidota bacterium]|nr:heavy-metal-associated domain-containing protein [Bacteroidota bacterium]